MFLIDDRSRALGPGCSARPDTGWWSARDSFNVFCQRTIKRSSQPIQVTHVYAPALTVVLILLTDTGLITAHLQHRRAPPSSSPLQATGDGQHEPEVHRDCRWHAGGSEPAVRGRWGDTDTELCWSWCWSLRERWEMFKMFWHLWSINSLNSWEYVRLGY